MPAPVSKARDGDPTRQVWHLKMLWLASPSMQWIRQLLSYAITLGVIIALVTIVPRCARLRVTPEFNDIDKLNVDESLNADTGVKLSGLVIGDAIAFQVGTGGEHEAGLSLGWVVALPGDEVSIIGKSVMVNGTKVAHGDPVPVPDRGPTMMPAGHCFVISDRHQFDSIAYGPLPAAAIRGKLRNLP